MRGGKVTVRVMLQYMFKENNNHICVRYIRNDVYNISIAKIIL